MAFNPVSAVSLISEDNAEEYSDSLSEKSTRQQLAVLNHYAEKMKLNRIFQTEDTGLNKRLEGECILLFGAANLRTYLEEGIAVPMIDSVAKASGMRYVLLTFNVGFIRTKENLKRENRKSIAPAILTLGSYYRYPIPASNSLQAMVLDMAEHKTCYFSNQYDGNAQTGSPVSFSVLDKQFYALFNFFFWLIPR